MPDRDGVHDRRAAVARAAGPFALAIVGAGWSGLAAAVDACARGDHVTVYEMAPRAGGRARSGEHGARVYDNGQHIMVGAYRETFELMQRVGVDLERALLRTPLALLDPKGRGLRLPAGPAVPAFVRGVLASRHWRWRTRLSLLRTAARWRRQGFVADADATVASLLGGVSTEVVREFFDPLCIAALNTPAAQASASVFLRVLRDALFSGPGSSDLMLPRRPLAELFPNPAVTWLRRHGGVVRTRSRVRAISRTPDGWQVEADNDMTARFDGVVLACSAAEAARLTAGIEPTWSQCAAGVTYQSIVTVYASHDEAHLPHPMLTLESDDRRPAQFVFDYGHLGGDRGRLGFVVSGANAWLERGLDTVTRATLDQARDLLVGRWAADLRVDHAVAERRATFACVPGLNRPRTTIAPGLMAAGDYVAGPYPATLEGAVRSGRQAAQAITSDPTAR